MLSSVFNFWIGLISTWINWLFTLKINHNPDISIGSFLLAFATIGLAIYFICGTDFVPGLSLSINNRLSKSSNGNDNYQPRHAYTPRHGKDK